MSQFHFKSKSAADSRDKFFRITAENFPVLKNLALQILDMDAGEQREPHFHPNAVQVDYCLSGQGQVGIVGPGGDRHVLDLVPGDAAFIPVGYVHWVKNTSEEPSRFMLIVSNELPETIEIRDLYAALPRELSSG